ncbi:rhomboid protease YqgP [Barrientosiimonas marina]|uniref:Rhomboid family intramembrane serine protease n=1 Tax=Lentibacillus kimchii TaxID=1542911 RepID=A0ABW2V1E9_9BACI
MDLDDSYIMYTLACHLTDQEGFEPLHLNQQTEELWLERHKGKTSQVIRLFHGGYDWKNHLKQDIGQVFQKVKTMKQYLKGKHIEIHNIYITAHSPVDDWNVLKKPMQLNEKNPIRMRVYYLSDDAQAEELAKLQTILGTAYDDSSASLSETEKETEIRNARQKLTDRMKQPKKDDQALFSDGRPFVIYFLLAINILIFLLLELKGDSTSTATLIDFGAKYNPAIIENGEWWRIVTAMFLHIGFVHLLMNMLAVYYLGSIVERIYGSLRFLVIYFLAGIGGGLASFAFTTTVSAGASGALFGLFGALLFFACIHGKRFFRTIGTNVLILIVINIVFGLSMAHVDNGAHIGGLIAGFIASAIMHLPGRRNWIVQISFLLIYVLIIGGLVNYGIDHNKNDPSYQLMQSQQLVSDGQYEKAADLATSGLEKSDNLDTELESHLLFQRSFAYIQLNQINQAKTDLEKSVKLNDSFAQAHYNLAILYNEQNATTKAKQSIEQAHELAPDNEDIQRLFEQLHNRQS